MITEQRSCNPDAEGFLRRYGWLVIGLIVLCFLAAMGFPEGMLGAERWLGLSAAGTRVDFQPSYSEIGVGESITVSVMVHDVEDLYSLQMVVRFDPTLLQVQDADLGQPGVQVGVGSALSQTVTSIDGFFLQTVDNVAGTIAITVSFAFPDLAFYGSGSLIDISFLGVGGGSSSLGFDQLVLSDSTGASIDLTSYDGTVVVFDGTITPSPSPTSTSTTTPIPTDVATIWISPTHSEVAVGMTTTVDIEISNVKNLYGATVELSFDPTLAQVVDADPGEAGVQIALGDLLSPDNVVTNQVDNTAGTIELDLSQIAPSPPVTGTGTLASIVFEGTHGGLSPISFTEVLLGNPDGVEIPAVSVDGELLVLDGSTLIGSVSFQGRPAPPSLAWRTPLSVTLTTPGGGGPDFTFGTVCDETGTFTITNIVSGTYHVKVRDLHSLWNVRQSQPIHLGLNYVNMGTLVEGDSNLSQTIDVVDFSILASTYAKSLGDPGYDPRADYNNSNDINVFDFSILASNFGRSGENILP
ncbi:MAG: hypothetical protein H5T69_02415 [Chloroflexi bacterium]|nr:hypothetical protein [Chloroflexota bacterium]